MRLLGGGTETLRRLPKPLHLRDIRARHYAGEKRSADRPLFECSRYCDSRRHACCLGAAFLWIPESAARLWAVAHARDLPSRGRIGPSRVFLWRSRGDACCFETAFEATLSGSFNCRQLCTSFPCFDIAGGRRCATPHPRVECRYRVCWYQHAKAGALDVRTPAQLSRRDAHRCRSGIRHSRRTSAAGSRVDAAPGTGVVVPAQCGTAASMAKISAYDPVISSALGQAEMV